MKCISCLKWSYLRFLLFDPALCFCSLCLFIISKLPMFGNSTTQTFYFSITFSYNNLIVFTLIANLFTSFIYI